MVYFTFKHNTMQYLKDHAIIWLAGVSSGFYTLNLMDGWHHIVTDGLLWFGKFIVSCLSAFVFGFLAQWAKHVYNKKFNPAEKVD